MINLIQDDEIAQRRQRERLTEVELYRLYRQAHRNRSEAQSQFLKAFIHRLKIVGRRLIKLNLKERLS